MGSGETADGATAGRAARGPRGAPEGPPDEPPEGPPEEPPYGLPEEPPYGLPDDEPEEEPYGLPDDEPEEEPWDRLAEPQWVESPEERWGEPEIHSPAELAQRRAEERQRAAASAGSGCSSCSPA